MKTVKTMYLLAAAFTLTAVTVNVSLAGARQSKMAELVKDNVQAKASVLDFLAGYFLGENSRKKTETCYALIESTTTCPTITLSSGELVYGTDKAKQLFASASVNVAPGNSVTVKGKLDADAGYAASFKATNSYKFKFEYKLEFPRNNYSMGFCKPTYPNDPKVIPGCVPYDECSQIVALRGDSYRKALGLN